MNIKINDIKLQDEDYIKVKKIAYEYYETYKKLSKKEQKNFLDNIKMNSPVEEMVLKNTLIFPDTEQLLSISQSRLLNHLKRLARGESHIEETNVLMKTFEYSLQNTQQLVADGLLSVMEEKKYAAEDIGVTKYLRLKNEALKCYPYFYEVELSKKYEFIENCAANWSYEDKIQLSTVLLPNDAELMVELENYSLVELSEKYKLPVELFIFKKQEYSLQDTKSLIETKKIKSQYNNLPLDYDEMDNSIVDKLWDQRFYKDVKIALVCNINNKLSKMYFKEDVKRK